MVHCGFSRAGEITGRLSSNPGASTGIAIANRSAQLAETEGALFGFAVQLISAAPKLRIAGAEERAFSRWAAGYARQRQLSISGLNDRIAVFHAILPGLDAALIFWIVAGGLGFRLSLGAFPGFNAAFTMLLEGGSTLSSQAVTIRFVISGDAPPPFSKRSRK